MLSAQLLSWLLVVFICLLSGLADAQGFIHASRIWQSDRLILSELAKSTGGFALGISTYWISLRFVHRLGIVSPELQAVLWFSVTIIGVAFVSGQFTRWLLFDQLLALAIVAGLGWLLFRSGTST